MSKPWEVWTDADGQCGHCCVSDPNVRYLLASLKCADCAEWHGDEFCLAQERKCYSYSPACMAIRVKEDAR